MVNKVLIMSQNARLFKRKNDNVPNEERKKSNHHGTDNDNMT